MKTKENKETLLRENTKKISIKEASAYSIHEGTGIRYITPFALAIGNGNPYTNTFIGMLTSLPSLIGNFSQFFTPSLMKKYSRKKIISVGVILQAIMWWGVIFAGSLYFIFKFNSTISLITLTFFYILLILFGSFVGPVWVSLMKDIVTEKKGEYFGNRNQVAGLFSLLSALIAGWFLDFISAKYLFRGFFILFFIAFVSRGISGLLFLKHYDPKIRLKETYYFSFYDFLRRIPKSNFGKFALFIALFILATSIASPFFTVYMLDNLGFSYIKWMIVILAGSLSSLLFMPMWGCFSDSYGNWNVIRITGFLIPLLPILWLISIFFNPSSYPIFLYLIILEIFSGLLWSGFNLSFANFIYDAVTRQKTALCSAYFNILQGVGIFIGATLGGFISSYDFSFFGLGPLLFLFALSGVTRFITYFLMISKIKEVRDVKNFNMNTTYHELRKIHIQPFLDIFHNRIIKPRPCQI